jgi:hypothetical protein
VGVGEKGLSQTPVFLLWEGDLVVIRQCLFFLISQPHSRQQGGEGLRAKPACQLPPVLLIRKTVISQLVPPGRFPLLAHGQNRGTQSPPLAEEVTFFSWEHQSSNIKQEASEGR